jgi:hypothetical protein
LPPPASHRRSLGLAPGDAQQVSAPVIAEYSGMNSKGRATRHKVLRPATLGLFLFATIAAAGAAAPQQQPQMRTLIAGSDPTTCSSSDEHRDTIVLKGQFPALDAHGAVLIVTQTGRQPIALPLDQRGATVPSFAFAADSKHAINVVYDGTQWCTVAGSLSFQVALGGMMSNIYTIQIDPDE